MDISVNRDGSGSLEIDLEISQEFIQELMESDWFRDSGELSTEGVCDQLFSSLNPLTVPFVNPTLDGVQFESQVGRADDGTGCRISWSVVWGSEHADHIFIIYTENDGPIVRRVGSDGWRFQVPLESENIDESDQHFEGSLKVKAALPGKSVVNNADRVSSSCEYTTFYWEIGLYGPPDPLVAETDGTNDCDGGWGTGSVVAVVFLGVLAASGSAALLVHLSRRSRVKAAPKESADHI